MSKRQLIEAIRELNRGAKLQFLDQFNEPQLQQYLDRLTAACDRANRAMYIHTVGGSVAEELRRVS